MGLLKRISRCMTTRESSLPSSQPASLWVTSKSPVAQLPSKTPKNHQEWKHGAVGSARIHHLTYGVCTQMPGGKERFAKRAGDEEAGDAGAT